MAFIPNGFAQVTHKFTIPGPSGPAMVVYGVIDAGAPTPPDDIAEACFDAWTASGSMISQQDSGTLLYETSVLTRVAGDLLPGIHLSNQAGSVSGANAPPSIGMLFQKQTGIAGRNRRGRMYLPGSKSVPEDGTYLAGAITSAQTSANVFMAALATLPGQMVLLHTSEADPPNQVTALVPVELAAHQRRRLR